MDTLDYVITSVEQPPANSAEWDLIAYPNLVFVYQYVYNVTADPDSGQLRWREIQVYSEDLTDTEFNSLEWAFIYAKEEGYGDDGRAVRLIARSFLYRDFDLKVRYRDYYGDDGQPVGSTSGTRTVTFKAELAHYWGQVLLEGVSSPENRHPLTPAQSGLMEKFKSTGNQKATDRTQEVFYYCQAPGAGISPPTLVPSKISLDPYWTTWNGEDPDESEDYEYGGTSEIGGGYGGSFDNSSDSIGIPSLPTGGAAASGLVTMFAPSAGQLADFGTFLWTTLFDGGFDSLLTSLKKWVNDPIESVVQLASFPVTPPAGSAQTLKFCGISSDLIGAGVSMNKCTSQFTSFDFGYIATPAYWKQALDYSPYTQISLYLPYIGIVPLKSDDVIDATLHLVYNLDLLTGGFSAFLEVQKNISGTPLSSVLYNWSGNMATQIPITSSNFSQVFGSMMTAVAAIGVGAVTGGLGAAAGGAAEGAGAGAVAGGALSGAGHGLAANIGNVINAKPHVTQSGRLDGTVGSLSIPNAYLIIERPVQSLSAKFQTEQGYPSNTVQTLKNLTGMTVCEAPIMDGFSGVNDDELAEIKSILTTGVIL